MASIVTDPNGRKRISIQAPDGSRKTIRLGEVPDAIADDYLKMAKHLNACQAAPHMVDAEILKKAADMPVQLYDRFARAGLLAMREEAAAEATDQVTLGSFLAELFKHMQVKPSTKTAYDHMKANLEQYFGKGRPLQKAGADNFTDKEVDQFRTWLTSAEGGGLSPATAARRIIAARQFFKKAVRWGHLQANPFADSRGGSQKNLKRRYFVPRELIDKALEV